MTKKFKSDAFEAIHSAISGMHKAGTVTKETMHRFDQSCLADGEPVGPKDIETESVIENESPDETP